MDEHSVDVLCDISERRSGIGELLNQLLSLVDEIEGCVDMGSLLGESGSLVVSPGRDELQLLSHYLLIGSDPNQICVS